jgi:pyrroloquinoline-quinone synthase
MYTKEKFKAELRNALESHISLDHPLFDGLFGAYPNTELMKITALQGYQLTKNFLTYIEELHYRCPLPKHKKRLLVNMFEEETGALSRTKNHVVLMEDFIRALGICDDERDAQYAFPETQVLIDYRMGMVFGNATYHLGAAAVMIASEGQSLETKAGEARHQIMPRYYNLNEKDLTFFSVHQKEDIGHVKEGISLVADLCKTEEMQEQAIEAVNHTCTLFYEMYDGILKHYKLNKAA